MSPEVLCHQKYCVARSIVSPEVLCRQKYCVTRSIISPEVLCHQKYCVTRLFGSLMSESSQGFLQEWYPVYSQLCMFQCVHYTGLGIRPQKDNKVNGYKLTYEKLPHVINAIEPYLSMYFHRQCISEH